MYVHVLSLSGSNYPYLEQISMHYENMPINIY